MGMAVYGNLGSLLLKSVHLLVLSSLLGTSLSSEKTASQKVVRLSFYLLNQRPFGLQGRIRPFSPQISLVKILYNETSRIVNVFSRIAPVLAFSAFILTLIALYLL